MSNIPVKWYDYRMAGGPSLSGNQEGTAGVVVGLLDAVLCDGFNTLTVDSVVVSGGVATVTRSAGLVFLQHQVIEIAGATPSGLNGQWRVATANGVNSLTFACPSVSDGSASGTITIKTPGLGWEKVFTATNRRVYRSQNSASPRSYYHINDTAAVSTGKTSLYCNASMLDIDTPVGQWAHLGASTYGAWMRPNAFSPVGGVNPWFVVGDDRSVWVVYQTQGITGGNYDFFVTQGFGDFNSFLLNDAKNEFCSGGEHDNATGRGCAGPANIVAEDAATLAYRYLRETALGVVGPAFVGVSAPQANTGIDTSALPWPSTVHNEIVITDMLIREVGTGGNPLRGKHRGIYHCMTGTPLLDQYQTQLVEDVAGLEGRLCAVVYQSISLDAGASVKNAGRVIVDLTGPW